jgi:hypothetical protein
VHNQNSTHTVVSAFLVRLRYSGLFYIPLSWSHKFYVTLHNSLSVCTICYTVCLLVFCQSGSSSQCPVFSTLSCPVCSTSSCPVYLTLILFCETLSPLILSCLRSCPFVMPYYVQWFKHTLSQGIVCRTGNSSASSLTLM